MKHVFLIKTSELFLKQRSISEIYGFIHLRVDLVNIKLYEKLLKGCTRTYVVDSR